jgi:hypothetical protein
VISLLLAAGPDAIPAAPVTVGPGTWINLLGESIGLLISVITILGVAKRSMRSWVRDAADEAIVPKLDALTSKIDRIDGAVSETQRRFDMHVVESTERDRRISELEHRVSDLIMNGSGGGRRTRWDR